MKKKKIIMYTINNNQYKCSAETLFSSKKNLRKQSIFFSKLPSRFCIIMDFIKPLMRLLHSKVIDVSR